MKKLFALVVAVSCSYLAISQDSAVVNPLTDTIPEATVDTLPITDPNDLIEKTEDENRRRSTLNIQQLALAGRSKDHLLIQVGIDNWSNKNDSINTTGLSRSFSMYLMFDFPFKTNPRMSIAVGAGVSTSNIYFKDSYVDVAGLRSNRLSFYDVKDTLHYKKYKLLTTYLEAPVEFRYMFNPERPKKTLKLAVGAKAGLLLGAGTKGKTLLNGQGNTVNNYIQKEKSKRYFNTARISVTGRIAYGAFGVFGSYQVNAFVKEGFGPDVRPYSIGLSISGL